MEKQSIAVDREGRCSVAARHGQQLVEAEVVCHVRHSSVSLLLSPSCLS